MNYRDEPELESFQEEYWNPAGNLSIDRQNF